MRLLNDRVNFAFAHQDQLFAIHLNRVAAGVLAKHDFVTDLDGQCTLLAVIQHLAITDRDDFTLIGLLLGGTGQDDASS